MNYCIDERDWRRTYVNLVPLEISPVESVLVNVDDGPVDGEPVRLVRDAHGVGVQDLANTLPVGGGHELGDAGMEAVQLLYVVPRVDHSIWSALAILSRSPMPSACCCRSLSIFLSSDSMISWRVPILVSITVVLSSKASSPRATISSRCLLRTLCDKPVLLVCMEGGRATWAGVKRGRPSYRCRGGGTRRRCPRSRAS